MEAQGAVAVILVIDNYDSFTYNLVQYLGQAGAGEIVVRRNDQVGLAEIAAMSPRGIMLSPGPCTPRESGVCLDILSAALQSQAAEKRFPNVPIFGVCLGHQAIGHVSGGLVERAAKIMHGKASLVENDGAGLFRGMPNPFSAIRYHSLVVREGSLPEGFMVSAYSQDDREIMGVRHESKPIEGVQFHPESVLTEQGFRIVENFLRIVTDFHSGVEG